MFIGKDWSISHWGRILSRLSHIVQNIWTGSESNLFLFFIWAQSLWCRFTRIFQCSFRFLFCLFFRFFKLTHLFWCNLRKRSKIFTIQLKWSFDTGQISQNKFLRAWFIYRTMREIKNLKWFRWVTCFYLIESSRFWFLGKIWLI